MVGSTRTRIAVVAIAIAVAVAVAVAVTLIRSEDPHEGLGGAVGLAEDPTRFDSSTEAGDTFAMIASVLLDDARACVASRSAEHPRCVALSEAAAYVQSVAVTAVTCTGPGVFELRERTLEYLRAIERSDESTRPPVARIPVCF
jgi:hypothetical protein